MKVQHSSADVCGVLVKAEISGAKIVNIISDFRGRTTASIQKCEGLMYKKNPYKLELYNADLGLFFSGFLSSKQACVNQFWEELRHAARTQPPADLFQDDQSREEYDLNQHEHAKSDWD
jgi:hypothetical protein